MAEQVYFEDVGVGSDIPALVKHITRQQLVRWAGASKDFFELHYDKEFARASGYEDVLVHGRLKAALLGQLLSDWVGEKGRVRKVSCSFRGTDFPGKDLTCKGTVIKKYVDQDEHCVECEIWTVNESGQKTTPGTGVVVLPSRESSRGNRA